MGSNEVGTVVCRQGLRAPSPSDESFESSNERLGGHVHHKLQMDSLCDHVYGRTYVTFNHYRLKCIALLQCEGTREVSSGVAESRCWDDTIGGELTHELTGGFCVGFLAGDAILTDLFDQVFGSYDMEPVGEKTQHGCWSYMM